MAAFSHSGITPFALRWGFTGNTQKPAAASTSAASRFCSETEGLGDAYNNLFFMKLSKLNEKYVGQADRSG
jgi:hypothetical protein